MMTSLLQPTIRPSQTPPTLNDAALRELVAPFGDPRPLLERALNSGHFVRTDPILLEALLGPLPQLVPGAVPCLDEERVSALWVLPEAGVLYGLPSGDLLAVHRVGPASGVMARLFSQQHDSEPLWQAIGAVYPGCVPGEERPRFALVREAPPLRGCEPTYVVLDLRTGAMLERGSEEATVRERCRWANHHPEAALAAMAFERARIPFVRHGASGVRHGGRVLRA